MLIHLMKKAYAKEKWHICQPGTTKNAIVLSFQCVFLVIVMAAMLTFFGILKLVGFAAGLLGLDIPGYTRNSADADDVATAEADDACDPFDGI